MSVFKSFITSDVIVSPFEVNKSFTFRGNELTASNVEIDRQYFTKWRTEVWDENELIYENTLDFSGKRVYIALDSKSLGDTIAWIPYMLEFKKKHNCHLIVSTFWNKLFKKSYPEIEFIEPGITVNNLNGMYKLGWFYNSDSDPRLLEFVLDVGVGAITVE